MKLKDRTKRKKDIHIHIFIHCDSHHFDTTMVAVLRSDSLCAFDCVFIPIG